MRPPYAELVERPRRNRRNAAIRDLVRETEVHAGDLILPIFIRDGEGVRDPIQSMPGVDRLSIDQLVEEVHRVHELGIPAIALFPALDESFKDRLASESTHADGLLQRAVRAVKDACPEVMVITDVAMDPYSSDGHDGLVEGDRILNDPTLGILAAMAVSQADAGADIVAPSDMMDGRVAAIRTALDAAGHTEVGILAYTAKYASAFYGPFRDALDSQPRAGDKKTYQMDPGNVREAKREARLDIAEGADMVMVKPALPYLDVVRTLADVVDVPVAAYQVSGEYAMIQAAAANGWLDAESALMETVTAIRRAGADFVLTYGAKQIARILAAR